MTMLKNYFANLWAAIRGKPVLVRTYNLPPGVYNIEKPIIIQGGGGSGEEKPK